MIKKIEDIWNHAFSAGLKEYEKVKLSSEQIKSLNDEKEYKGGRKGAVTIFDKKLVNFLVKEKGLSKSKDGYLNLKYKDLNSVSEDGQNEAEISFLYSLVKALQKHEIHVSFDLISHYCPYIPENLKSNVK